MPSRVRFLATAGTPTDIKKKLNVDMAAVLKATDIQGAPIERSKAE